MRQKKITSQHIKTPRFVRNDSGLAFIEFALILPLLLLFFLGAVELTRYILVNQKADKAAGSLANLLSAVADPEPGDAAKLDGALDALMSPYNLTTAGAVISRITKETDDTPAKIVWQHKIGAGGTSRIGSAGSDADIGSLAISAGAGVMGVEFFYTYDAILGNFKIHGVDSIFPFNGSPIYHAAFYQLRQKTFKLPNTPLDIPNITDNVSCCGPDCDTNPKPACECTNTCPKPPAPPPAPKPPAPPAPPKPPAPPPPPKPPAPPPPPPPPKPVIIGG